MLNASMGIGIARGLLPFADRWARGARFGKIPSVGRGRGPSLQDKEVRYRLAVARGMIQATLGVTGIISGQLRYRSCEQTAIVAPCAALGLHPRLSAHDRQLVSVTVKPSQKFD
jgi:hypothetical protein